MSRSVVSAVMALLTAAAQLAAQAPDLQKPEKPGVCAREGARIAGKEPLVIAKGIPVPRKVRNVKPKVPEGIVASGLWSGEVLIGLDGKVSQVWTIQEGKFAPSLNRAVVDAVRQWEFEPAFVKSEGTPVCMKVTVRLDLE
jgi:hypothetical protein